MQVVILAGGKGSRARGIEGDTPKPLLTIGGKPIIWHIMKRFKAFGINDILIAGGYKFDLLNQYCKTISDEFQVNVFEASENEETGGRLYLLKDFLKDDFFCVNGDTLIALNYPEVISFHKKYNRKATLVTSKTKFPFGVAQIVDNQVVKHIEKPTLDLWVNTGVMVFKPSIFEDIHRNTRISEDLNTKLVEDGELSGYKFNGFYHNLETFKDYEYLNKVWNTGNAPWKNW